MFENIFGDKCKIEKNEPLNKMDAIGNELMSMYIGKILLNIKKTQKEWNMFYDSIIEHDDDMISALLPNMRKTLNNLQKITCEFDDGVFFKIEKDLNECYMYILQSSSIERLKKYILASNNVVALFEDSELNELNEHNQSIYIRIRADIRKLWFDEFVKSFELKCRYNIKICSFNIKEIKTKTYLNKVIGNSFNLIPVPMKIYQLCENATEK